MAIINIGKNNNYKAEKSFVPDYVDYVIEREMEEHLKEYDEHMSNTDNPHKVTKSQVGLSNVDNTSDLNKPISTATQAALDKKANQTDVDSIKNNTTLIKNSGGGFSAGENADTETGGSAGRGSFSTTGGASGHLAQTQTGGAVGQSTKSTSGGAVGTMVQTQTGGAVGTSATSTNGGAIGSMANTTTGGAVGEVANSESGGAVGFWASSESGGAVGNNTGTSSGGAIGNNSHSGSGASVGENTSSTTGGAIGADAKAGAGFAGGKSAKAVDSSGGGIDAIQLGTGTNSAEGTLQVYSYQLLDEEGKIPDARLNDATSDGGLYGRKDGAWERVTKDAIGLSNVDNTSDANKPISAETQAALDAITENTSNIQNSSGGFSAGMTSQAKGGGAVGSGSYANSGFAGGVTAYAGFGGAVGAYAQVTGGGAVGQNAVTSDGFAGGKNAIAGEDYSNGIDAIQLGTGTNSAPKTMQVYGYQLLDANGKIPDARLNDAPSDGTLYGRKNGGWAAVTAGLETVDIDDIDDIKTEGLYRLNNYFEEELPSGQTADQKYVELLVVSDYVYVSDPSVRQTRYKSDGTVITREFNYMDNGGTWYDWQEVGHTHANKAILDATEVAYTESDQARISTLENDLDTFYTDLNDLQNTALSDAPSDGNTYARKDGAWTNLTRQIGKQLINFVPLEYDGSDVTDLDNLPSGITIVDYADGPGYGGYMVMTSLEGSGYGYQIKISIEGLSYRYNNGTWGAWIKIG